MKCFSEAAIAADISRPKSHASDTQTLEAAGKDVMNSAWVFEEQGTPACTCRKVGHGLCLTPAVCLLFVTWARCQDGTGAVLGRILTVQEMPVLRTKTFLSAELALEWSLR